MSQVPHAPSHILDRVCVQQTLWSATWLLVIVYILELIFINDLLVSGRQSYWRHITAGAKLAAPRVTTALHILDIIRCLALLS